MSRSLLVKVTCGTDDPERANQGFTVAATAVGAGVDVSLWGTGDAVLLLTRTGLADLGLEFATPLTELVPLLLEGGRVTACSQCVERRGVADDLLPGVRIAGAAAFVEEALAAGGQALVY